MNISRRGFLAASVAAPAVAIAPAVVHAQTSVEAITSVTPTAPIEFPFQYWVGDGYRYGVNFDTLEEAMRYAIDCGDRMVLYARQMEVDWSIGAHDVDVMLEQMHEWVSENYGDPDGDGDDPALDETPEQRAELVSELNAVFQAWLHRHRLGGQTAWQFDTRDQKQFPVPSLATDGGETVRREEM